MLLRLGLLVIVVGVHYAALLCYKAWYMLWSKPWTHYSNGHKWTGSNSQRYRSYGLKETIALPATGDEAMKRLLSCRGKDPYSILGLRPDASSDDIKKYYRRQAVLVHPDKNQQPGAEEAFKILGHAFDLIGDPVKRSSYDAQRFEADEAHEAMHEFGDLLTKLHEKMQEAANMMCCDHCGGKHKRTPVDIPAYAARFCERCHDRHPAKEGDMWAESRVFGFRWHYYACMQGKVYDITEWASCKSSFFKHMQSNSHQVMYKIHTGGGRQRQSGGRNEEAELEDILNQLFQKSGGVHGAGPDGSNCYQNFDGAQSSQSPWGRAGAPGGQAGHKKARRRRRRH